MFSEAKSEGEILLLPNATLRVMDIQPPTAADNFYRIRLVQTG
jgi:hypothetical protein